MDEFLNLFDSASNKYADDLNEQFQKQTGMPFKLIGKHLENLAGTGGGKSLREKAYVYYFCKDLFNEIYVISPNGHTDQYEKIGVKPDNIYTQPITDELLQSIISKCKKNYEEPPDGAPATCWSSLICIDDVGDRLRRLKTYDTTLIHCRHQNISIHTLVQHRTFNSPSSRANQHHYIIRPSEWTNDEDCRKFCSSRGLVHKRNDQLSITTPTLQEAIAECTNIAEKDGDAAKYDYIFINCDTPIPEMYRGRGITLHPIRTRLAHITDRSGRKRVLAGEYDHNDKMVTYRQTF